MSSYVKRRDKSATLATLDGHTTGREHSYYREHARSQSDPSPEDEPCLRSLSHLEN